MTAPWDDSYLTPSEARASRAAAPIDPRYTARRIPGYTITPSQYVVPSYGDRPVDLPILPPAPTALPAQRDRVALRARVPRTAAERRFYALNLGALALGVIGLICTARYPGY